MAELETDEDLGLALRPLEHRSGPQVLPVRHADLLQYAPVDLQSLVDHSRNFVPVVGGRSVELVEALKGREISSSSFFRLEGHCCPKTAVRINANIIQIIIIKS